MEYHFEGHCQLLGTDYQIPYDGFVFFYYKRMLNHVTLKAWETRQLLIPKQVIPFL